MFSLCLFSAVRKIKCHFSFHFSLPVFLSFQSLHLLYIRAEDCQRILLHIPRNIWLCCELLTLRRSEWSLRSLFRYLCQKTHILPSVCSQSSILLNIKGVEGQLMRWMTPCTSHMEGWTHPNWKQQTRRKNVNERQCWNYSASQTVEVFFSSYVVKPYCYHPLSEKQGC